MNNIKDDIRRTILEVIDGDINDTNNMNNDEDGNEIEDMYLSDSNVDDLYKRPQNNYMMASNYTNITSNTSFEGSKVPYYD